MTPSGKHEYRQYQVPDYSNRLVFNNAIPFVTMYSGQSADGFQIYTTNGTTISKYSDLTNVSNIDNIAQNDSTVYMSVSQGVTASDWSPCNRLYRFSNERAAQVLGNISYYSFGADDTIVYGEPIDSCQHTRLWETDMDGKNAKLLADDLQTTWWNPVVL